MEKIPAVVKDGQVVACEQCGEKLTSGSVGNYHIRKIYRIRKEYKFGCGSIARLYEGEGEWQFLQSSDCKIAVNSQRLDSIEARLDGLGNECGMSNPEDV